MKPGLSFYLNLMLLIFFLFGGYHLVVRINQEHQKETLLHAKSDAQRLLDRNLAIHTYFSNTLKPKVFELIDSEKNNNYFEPSWMSSTFAVREINKLSKTFQNDNYYYKECAINARSPENEADNFERAFIEELNSDPGLNERTLVREIGGERYFVVMQRGEMMEESCLLCHSVPDKAPQGLIDHYGDKRSFNRSVGEVVSAISIRIPLENAYKSGEDFTKGVIISLAITLLLLFLIQYILHRICILSPIENLKKQALDISSDEQFLGKQIPLPASQEFSELTSAFNRMSAKLKNNIDNLEKLVDERTADLKSSNIDLQNALNEIKTLQGIIPICMYCHQIRDDKGSWTRLEKYISDHTDAEFSHGICDRCFKKHNND